LNKNFFDHFGLPIGFLPDAKELRSKYLAFSKANHPDYAAGDDAAYEQALIQTSLNNQAYKTLSDDFERIRYTLELLGEPIVQEDKLPPMFLMDMMEWNERIMEAGMNDNKVVLDTLTKEFDTLESTFDVGMQELLSAYEKSQDKADLKEIKNSYLQRKYLLRLRESINKFARL
jgi:molecular chaperone HscB